MTSSWFLVAGLVAVMVAPRIEQVQPGLGAWKFVAGLAFAVLLYLAILLHEASHAVMARRFGAQVTSITLHFLGGMTAVKGESRSPRQEFWVAVVGPITSLVIGGAALAAWFVTPPGLLRVGVEGLAGANLLIGVLNLVPALPLDGGRVLKSGVWKVTGSPHRGAIVAGWAGRVLAFAVLGWPLAMSSVLDIRPGLVDYLLAGVLAIFLFGGANQAIAQAKLLERLPALVARDMSRRVALVEASQPIAVAVATAQNDQAGSIVTCESDGTPVGLVNEQALMAVPGERRPWMPVSAVARTLGAHNTMPVGLSGEDLVRFIGRNPAPEYLLVQPDGTIHGVLSTGDVDQAFRGEHN